MDSNPICNPSPTTKMKCLFLYYVQLLMISWAGRWTQTPSATPLKPQKWNAHFCITFNFWWLAGLVIGLKPHPPPLSSQKNEMLIFGLHLISDDQAGWSMDSNPIHHLSPGIKWNAYFCIMFNLWWSARLVIGLQPHLLPLFNQKNEMLVFVLHYTSDDQPGWSMDSKPIHHPSPAKKWNAHFWITFNFWWSVRLVIGLQPHLLPLFNQKNDMLIFGTRSTSYDWPGWSMDSNPICHPSPAKKIKCLFLDYIQLLVISRAGWWTQTPSATPLQPRKWNACFWITFNFWWSIRLVNGLKPHLPPLSNQKNDMLIFGLRSTSYDWLGWSMDSNPICNLFSTKKWNACFCITL